VNNKKAVTEENTGGHLTNTNKIQKTFIRKHCKNTGTKYTRLIN